MNNRKLRIQNELMKKRRYQMQDIDKIIEQLNESTWDEEERVRELIGKGIEALPKMLDAIRNGPTPIHILLKQVILQINDHSIMDEMRLLLDDENAYIRHIVYRILSRTSDREVIERMKEDVLNDRLPDSDRGYAAKALGEGLHLEALPTLKEQLDILDKEDNILYSPDLTLAIAEAMVRLGDSSALPYVLELCRHEDDLFTQLLATKKLRFFSGQEVFEQLRRTLESSDYEMKEDAVDALSLLGTKGAAFSIWEACKDEDESFARYARNRFTRITGIEVQEGDLQKGFNEYLAEKEVVMSDNMCFRSGKPIDVEALVKKLTESEPSVAFLEELFTITGNRFGHDPDIWIYAKEPDYNAFAHSWLDKNQGKYSAGNLYKFGVAQKLD